MIRHALLALVILFGATTLIQPTQAQTPGEQAVLETLKVFFDGLTAQDSTRMWPVTDRGARLVITTSDESGTPVMSSVPIEQFMTFITDYEGETMLETYWDPQIRIEDNLATAWVRYNFFVGEQLDHCGEDAFQFFRSTEGWKIIAVADTQRREGCEKHE